MKDLEQQAKDPEEQRNILFNAIKKHHDQIADDRCQYDDNELYEAAGLAPTVPTVGDPVAMLRNCKRFIRNRCIAGGEWRSYVELLTENNELKLQVAQLQEEVRKAKSGDTN